MGADIANRGIELCARERPLAPDHFPAETKAAIGGADMDRLEQHPVGIAMHDASNGTVDLVPDRIADLLRVARKFRRVRNELARDGIGRIGAIDEFGYV